MSDLWAAFAPLLFFYAIPFLPMVWAGLVWVVERALRGDPRRVRSSEGARTRRRTAAYPARAGAGAPAPGS